MSKKNHTEVLPIEVPDLPNDVIVDIRDLRTTFATDDGSVAAVDGVSFSIKRGTTTCIVGESGSGKSVTARSIIQVVENPGVIERGEIWFQPTDESTPIDLLSLDPKGAEIRQVRGAQVGLIFQEPMASLSPVHTIGDQISEVLTIHEGVKPKEVRDRVIEELQRVGIPRPEERIDSYTFQLSGGMRQRAMIAMALIARPALVIADEPTTALDVTTQAQILDLLRDLKKDLGMTLIFITHDLGVVAEIADNVIVMRDGKIVEAGAVEQIFHAPQADYTKKLLSALPQRWEESEEASALLEQGQDDRAESARTEVSEPESQSDDDPAGGDSTLLQIKNLSMVFDTVAGKQFGRKRKGKIHAVNDVSLDIPKGKTIGLVGESGCGKTTLGRCVMRAYKPTAGELLYRKASGDVVDLAQLSDRALLPYRRDIRMVFQDPYGSLNPRMTVQQVISEPLRVAGLGKKDEYRDMVGDMLERVGLKRSIANRYPHAFSGGERQRIGIARALITNPRLVVADEAVSALDVSVRTQVLELLAELQQELDLTYLFISHDLSVVERICDDVAVMYFGNLVENRPAAELFAYPEHGYTKALLSAVPISDPSQRGTRQRIIYDPAA